MPTTMPPSPRHAWLGDLGAFILGLMLPLAFAPFRISLLAIVIPALWLLLLFHVSAKRALWRGWLFALGFLGVGISWVYVSLHVYGQANAWLAAILTALMIMLLAIFPALQAYILTRFFPKNNLSKCLLAFPSLWVLAECGRMWFLTGFPWLFLGYTQINSPLSGFAPVVGVFGVSWIVAFTSGVIAIATQSQKQFKTLFFPILLLVAFWLAGAWLNSWSWTEAQGKPLSISLIQGNIPQQLKWQPDQAEASLAIYKNLTEQHLSSQLIIWPEAAVTFYQSQIADFLANVDGQLKTQKSALITGIPIEQQERFYNGLLALGTGEGTYLKRHLVPFGEYMPLRSILVWLKNYLLIPMSDFSAGPTHQPLVTVNNIPLATFICYEIAYPMEVRQQLPQGQLLITISDDSWFGKSLAPPQHLEIAQMRSLETGRYSLMSTNDGLTAIISPKGKVLTLAPPFQRTVLTGEVQPMIGSTPWVRLGLYPLLLALLICLLIARLRQPTHKRQAKPNS